MDECLLDRSPYPIESECGREWKERGPSLSKASVRAPGRLEFLFQVQVAQAPARTLNSPVPDRWSGRRVVLARGIHVSVVLL